jgi:hypothetical protein
MSGRVQRLAVELAEVVVAAGGDVVADEVREWLQIERRATVEQVYAAGRIAESRGWIERHGKRNRRLLWGAPRTEGGREG